MNIILLAKEVSGVRLVGVGESTHGTHEFFATKTQLFIELVKEHGFNTFMLEDSDIVCRPINQYIKSGERNPKTLMNHLYSVWRVHELLQLIEWLRDNYSSYPVQFVGFDINQSKENIYKRDELMAHNIIKFLVQDSNSKALIWAHNSHIKVTSEDDSFKPMGMFLRQKLKQEYVAIAQLFGKGEFNATCISESRPGSNNRTLKPVKVLSLPSNLAENKLSKLGNEESILNKEQLISKGFGKPTLVRSLGWGLVLSRLNEYIESCNLAEEFDWLIYYPTATVSHVLESVEA